MRTRRDWQGLERKILEGKPVEDAALEMGIPLEDAEKHLKEGIKRAELTDQRLLRDADTASETALKILIGIAKAGPRSRELEDTVDLQAAKTLLDYSLKARKLARDTSRISSAPSGQRDLFDQAAVPDVKGPWDLKDPGT